MGEQPTEVSPSDAEPPQQGASGQARTVSVPSVVGLRLDRATKKLQAVGLRVNEECSGLFGCVIKSNWEACHQTPDAGKRIRKGTVVVVYAERPGEC
jgi:beta-lactam-binding protein with PASTA domain